MREYVIFAVPENGNRIRLGAMQQNVYPLPSGAEVITRVVEPDVNMMLSWAKRKVDRGMTIDDLKTACE